MYGRTGALLTTTVNMVIWSSQRSAVEPPLIVGLSSLVICIDVVDPGSFSIEKSNRVALLTFERPYGLSGIG